MKLMKRQNKLYNLKESPFYLLRSKKQLEKILFIKWDCLEKLLAQENSYREFINKKGRPIQAPLGEMKRIHKRIANLLARIQTPTYLTSKKGYCYIDNAKIHMNSKKIIKTDIQKFFPNTLFHMVYSMFLNVFKCSGDIACVLAKLCCFKQKFIPTGSHLSGVIAFFAGKAMFDEIEESAILDDCCVSVYVDDITISGEHVDRRKLWDIRKIIKKYGYRTTQKKSKFYKTKQPKIVTGVVIHENKLLLPNKRHLKIHKAYNEYNHSDDLQKKYKIYSRIQSMIREANKIILFNHGN
jgi:hypothetical protein